jgi:phospholipid transport system transporter-binding protein
MTTRRKPGKAGKKSTAPRKTGSKPAKGSATRVRASAPAKRATQPAKASQPVKASLPAKASKSAASKSAAAKVGATKARTAPETAPLATVPADCTIAQAGDLKADLARVLDAAAAVTLDLSAVRRIDTAALQVLTSFIRERRAAGRGVECQGASDAFLATADVLGLRALFSPVIDDRLAAPAAGNA